MACHRSVAKPTSSLLWLRVELPNKDTEFKNTVHSTGHQREREREKERERVREEEDKEREREQERKGERER